MMKQSKDKKDFETLFDDTQSELKQYIEKRLESLKLRAYEKTALTGSFIVYGLLIMQTALFIFFLILFTLGFFLGELLNSTAAGFGILIAISLLILFIFVLSGKVARRRIINLIITLIRKIEKDEE